jgi:hypothetical protein
MCDYSLEMYGSRLAEESERCLTTRFPSGSIGLTMPGDCGTAVCVPYETRLTIDGVSRDLQTLCGVPAIADAVFVRLDHGAYRDGLRFENGREVSLQQLGTGVGVSIMRIPAKVTAPVVVEAVHA